MEQNHVEVWKAGREVMEFRSEENINKEDTVKNTQYLRAVT